MMAVVPMVMMEMICIEELKVLAKEDLMRF